MRIYTRASPPDRFIRKVEKTNYCWNWKGYIKPNGYGTFYDGIKQVYAHRFSFQHFINKIPKDMCVLHKCDNRKCVRPIHLWIGTYLDNNRDTFKKGRRNNPKGEMVWCARFTERIILKIRQMRREGMLLRELANKFNVTHVYISKICTEKLWKHIPLEEPSK